MYTVKVLSNEYVTMIQVICRSLYQKFLPFHLRYNWGKYMAYAIYCTSQNIFDKKNVDKNTYHFVNIYQIYNKVWFFNLAGNLELVVAQRLPQLHVFLFKSKNYWFFIPRFFWSSNYGHKFYKWWDRSNIVSQLPGLYLLCAFAAVGSDERCSSTVKYFQISFSNRHGVCCWPRKYHKNRNGSPVVSTILSSSFRIAGNIVILKTLRRMTRIQFITFFILYNLISLSNYICISRKLILFSSNENHFVHFDILLFISLILVNTKNRYTRRTCG